jgi:hypothetical protein
VNYIDRHHRRTQGRPLDLNRAFWTPPLRPHDAYQLERGQIERELGLKPLVSITDHDDLTACGLLQLVAPDGGIPYSVEWTVPFGTAVFHLGVHNLPARHAQAVGRELAEFTRGGRPRQLEALLADLSAMPEVLVVLNHPLCDEGRVGFRVHRTALDEFLRRYRPWLHALELNGLQPWRDNLEVAGIGRALGIPLVSGGDRHGLEPNGNLNLTNATSFSEFAWVIRRDKTSEVLFMPQCREPLAVRIMECAWDVFKDYPEQPGRVHWSDRMFYCLEEGKPQPLSELLGNGGPAFVSHSLSLLGFLRSRHLRPALRAALLPRKEVSL